MTLTPNSKLNISKISLGTKMIEFLKISSNEGIVRISQVCQNHGFKGMQDRSKVLFHSNFQKSTGDFY